MAELAMLAGFNRVHAGYWAGMARTNGYDGAQNWDNTAKFNRAGLVMYAHPGRFSKIRGNRTDTKEYIP